MAWTVTFPTAGRSPEPEEVEGWVTQLGEPFERDGPNSLLLRALPVRLVVIPKEHGFQAHIDVTLTAPLVRLVDLIFTLSVRAGADVRLAGTGEATRSSLWLRLADEQDRQRLARAIQLAQEQGKKDEVVRGLWSVLGAIVPDRDVRWDVARSRVVELKEVDQPGGISLEDAAFLVENPSPGDVVTVPVEGHPHVVAWRWLSEAFPGLSDW
jgi:hypothetical protein